MAGVISDVDLEINDSDLAQLLPSTIRILDIHCIGRSRCVKVVFQCDSLPASVKVGYVRHRVRPYVPRPLQCHKCQKLGHVSAACKNALACKWCGDAHDFNCKGMLNCVNCSGLHEATSHECLKTMHERRVLRLWSDITLRIEMLQHPFGDVVEAPVRDVDCRAVYLSPMSCKPHRRHRWRHLHKC